MNTIPQTFELQCNPEQQNRIAKLEELRQLIKVALMNDALNEKEHTIILHKATDIGLDANVFEMQLESLLHLKDKACKKRLFKRQSSKEYFDDSDCLDGVCGFDTDFNSIFLSNEERGIWIKKRSKQYTAEMASVFDGYSEILRGINTLANIGTEGMKIMSEMSKYSSEISENMDAHEKK